MSAERTFFRTTEFIASRLEGVQRDEQRLEVAGMLRRHLWARSVVTDAFQTARAVARTAAKRGVRMPAIAGSGVISKPGDIKERVVRLYVADISTRTVEVEAIPGEEADRAVALLQRLDSRANDALRYREIAEIDLSNLFARDADRAGELVGWGHTAREVGIGTAISAAIFLAECNAGENHMRLAGGSDFSSYMLATIESKTNAPQTVAAWALARLGFRDAEVFNTVRDVRRLLDASSNVDRAQIAKLTARFRDCSAQRHTARA